MMTIRPATAEDAPAIASIYAPYCESTAVSFETNPPSADDMRARLAQIGRTRPWLVLDDGGRVAGYAYAGIHHERAAYQWSVNTAVYVARTHHRRGVGRALYTTLFDLLRRLGYFKACAGITLPNEASVGLHRALGFSLVGVYHGVGYKLGAWHDVAWYEAELQPERADPPAPRPTAALHQTEWNEAVREGLAAYGTRA